MLPLVYIFTKDKLPQETSWQYKEDIVCYILEKFFKKLFRIWYFRIDTTFFKIIKYHKH